MALVNGGEQDGRVDVLIHVFSKPFQTALAILSLLRHSGDYIDKIYFHEEPYRSEFERKDHGAMLDWLGERAVYHPASVWIGSGIPPDLERARHDEAYRHSVRYQYGWEKTDKKHALVIHNDIVVTADVVGAMLAKIGEATAIGEIGQCWWCPAGQAGLCGSGRYTAYRPNYEELMRIYNDGMDYTRRRAYNIGLNDELKKEPWPLPECRVNEWCLLVNIKKARPDTLPNGPAAPLGAQLPSGARIGENWDEDVLLDTGVKWFHDLNLMRHSFADFPIEDYIIHDRKGRTALSDAKIYVRNEVMAKNRLQKEYPDFYKLMA